MKKMVCLVLFLIAFSARAAELKVATPKGEKSFSLAELKHKIPVVTVTIDDPVFKQKKVYDGFPLGDLLRLAGMDSEAGDELVFQALDGYAPTLSFKEALAHDAVVAFQEHGTVLGWHKLQQGKTLVSPAPFYLIWKEGKKLPESFPWSYQLSRIELVSFAVKYSKLFPAEMKPDSSVYKGFLTFKTQCLRCHSLNLAGGELAPELNVPKNITEYWDGKTLREFILDSSSFRLKSKMPIFKEILKKSELDDLLDYLIYMREHKR